MTRYCVQISRWFEVEADDEDAAEEAAFAMEYTAPCKPIVNVTDLDEAAKIGAGNSG